MSKSSIEILQHILDESLFILKSTQGFNLDTFYKDEILKRAIVRSIEIIGEATKKIDEETRLKYAKVKWNSMARTRDKLIHHYFGVDYEIVWSIVEYKIPELIEQIEGVIKQEKNES